MCIRDRVLGEREEAARLLARGVVLGEVAARLAHDPDRRVPVSYTHLRAPETVLDLVCRLLLAKKIQKHNNT